jgi:hypothetical protein
MRQLCRRGSSIVIAAMLGMIGITACSGIGDPAPPLGHLQVFVTDSATGAGVGGLPMQLFVGNITTGPNGSIETAGQEWAELRTSTDGTGEFRPGDGGVIIQPYVVRLDLTATNYTLAAGETNDKPVTVAVGQTVTVTFKLHKGPVGGGGAG